MHIQGTDDRGLTLSQPGRPRRIRLRRQSYGSNRSHQKRDYHCPARRNGTMARSHGRDSKPRHAARKRPARRRRPDLHAYRQFARRGLHRHQESRHRRGAFDGERALRRRTCRHRWHLRSRSDRQPHPGRLLRAGPCGGGRDIRAERHRRCVRREARGNADGAPRNADGPRLALAAVGGRCAFPHRRRTARPDLAADHRPRRAPSPGGESPTHQGGVHEHRRARRRLRWARLPVGGYGGNENRLTLEVGGEWRPVMRHRGVDWRRAGGV